MTISIIKFKKIGPLGGLFLSALLVRLLFSFYFQKFYFGDFQFKYGDGSTYLNPIINFVNNFEYIGDVFISDSKYFRPPVYPTFLGIIYLLVSELLFDYVVAGIQCIIGSFTVLLIYGILLNIFETRKLAIITGYIFAFYPFSILWTPLMYTETLQLFIILSIIYISTIKNIKVYAILIQGFLVGIIFLTKQYLTLIILIPIFVILFNSKYSFQHRAINLLFLMLAFVSIVTPWIVRNYISSNSIIIFFGKTSGLRNALDDMVEFTQFANKFDENTTEHINSVVEEGTVRFSKHKEFLISHERDIAVATKLAHQCGGSFLERRKPTLADMPPHSNCNQEVVLKFNKLSEQFWREVPLWEALETRRDALWKIVTKSDLINKNLRINKSDILKYWLFKYRILLLILGFSGMLTVMFSKTVDRQQKVFTASILVTAIAFYLFFCLILLSAEMRYLLTPDLLISLFAFVIPTVFLKRALSNLKAAKNRWVI